MSHHYHPLQKCLARIFYSDEARKNSSCGTGVVLHGNMILTCAHVINTSLGLPRISQEKPEQTISLDFPLTDSTQRLPARVVFWDPDTDLAGLELLETLPDEISPVSLTITDELWGHSVQAFGFPSRHELGTWADCTLRGPVTSKWIEIIDPLTTGNFIQQGFSGGPVWDETTQCCVGIVVAVDRNEERRVGYLIPAHKIVEKWDGLPCERKLKPRLKRGLPLLLPYLVNRREQEEYLRKLYEKNDRRKPKPMVGIIHGDDKQAHDMFLKRIADEYIPRLLESKTPVYRYQIPWPAYIQNIDELQPRLIRGIADAVLHTPEANCEAVQHVLAAYNSPVVFELELLTDDWLKHKKGILEAILEFWNNWPPLIPGQNLFVFLYITHRIPETHWIRKNRYLWQKKQIFNQLKHCTFQHYEKITGKVIPELANISHSDTRLWARTELQEYFDGDLTLLQANISELFEESDTLPMAHLAPKLREFLQADTDDQEVL